MGNKKERNGNFHDFMNVVKSRIKERKKPITIFTRTPMGFLIFQFLSFVFVLSPFVIVWSCDCVCVCVCVWSWFQRSHPKFTELVLSPRMLRRKLKRLKQHLNEATHQSKPFRFDTEFLRLKENMEVYSDFFERINTCVLTCLQPNPVTRAKTSWKNSVLGR